MKKKIKSIMMQTVGLRDAWFYLNFFRWNRYIPNIKNPRTFNEKINHRKRHPKNPLYTICADKVGAKQYVANLIGDEYIIENYYVGDRINEEILIDLLHKYGEIVVKTTHDSGGVYVLGTDIGKNTLSAIVSKVNTRLKVDHGKITNEPWYSAIKPQVLIEQRLTPTVGTTDLRDFKFHVFNTSTHESKIILQVDYERGTRHHRSFFDSELNYLAMRIKVPTIETKLERPTNFDRMLEIAESLGKPFSYSRIDLYNVDGKIYFGEFTFGHGSGMEPFSDKSYDSWFGSLWTKDPRK